MVELKDLTREERTLVTIQCDSFFLDLKRSNAFKKVYNHLLEIVPNKYSNEVWVIITACAQSLRKGGTGSQISLRPVTYATANKIHNKGISYLKMKELIPLKEGKGFITFYKGFHDKRSSTSIKSCFLMTDRFISLFEDIDLNKFVKHDNKYQYVEVRDSKTKENITDSNKLVGIASKRELVAKYNSFITSHDIRVKGQKAVVVYKRVYSGDLESAGRWYSFNGFQTASRDLRPTITIDGIKTTEVDMDQIHPRILYTLEGIQLDKDFEPYSVYVEGLEGDSVDVRRLLKLSLLCLINSESRTSAIRAINSKLLNDRETKFPSVVVPKGVAGKIVDALYEHNSPISKYFYEDRLWAKLQKYDSDMTAYIVESFISTKRLVLPWHDSYVCCVHDRDFLLQVMQEAWGAILKTDMNFSATIEW